MSDNSNGSSIMFLRPLRTTTGSHIHLIFNPMETQLISDVLQPTPGGGNYSDTKELMLLMREERSYMYKETKIKKTEILRSRIETMVSINNGILYMLTNGKVNQAKVNSMKTSDSM